MHLTVQATLSMLTFYNSIFDLMQFSWVKLFEQKKVPTTWIVYAINDAQKA